MIHQISIKIVAGLLITFCLILVCPFMALGEVPDRVSYQGYLTDTNGDPLVDGDYPMGFAIYDDPFSNTVLWSEAQTVSVVEGVFNVYLGLNPFPENLFDGDLYLEVELNGERLKPRQHLKSTPFAMKAAKADAVVDGAVTIAMIASNAVNSTKIVDNSVTAADLAANSVNASEISTGAVGTLEIADGTVTAADLFEDYVNTSGDTMTGTLELAENLILPETTATSGIIRSGTNTLIHTYGTVNFFAGPNAGNLTMSGNYNTGSGVSALLANTTGSDNTAHGRWALRSNLTGSYNTASGSQALYDSESADHNTAHGYRALRNTTGSNNTAIGSEALAANTTGSSNTAIGRSALRSNITGFNNTATGVGALVGNLSGNYNAANGIFALNHNTEGHYNTASGYAAFLNNETGSYNTGFGSSAGSWNLSGSYNTFIGADAGTLWTADNLTNATALGYDAIVDASNRVRIGNWSVTQIGGNVAWSNLSDIRNKEDIAELDLGLEFITALRPVSFTLMAGNGRMDLGFIAQEVEEILGTEYNILGIGGDAERTLSLRYTDFIAPMVKAIQEQQEIIERQNEVITELQSAVAVMQEKVAAVQAVK